MISIRVGMAGAAAVLAACGGVARAGQAQTGRAAAPAAGPGATTPDRLDVAGVRIGMTAAEADAALKRGGWRTRSFPGKDWAAEVEYEAGRQRGRMVAYQPLKGVETIQAEKGDEKVIVQLRAVLAGPVVTGVSYTAPMSGRDPLAFAKQLYQRYGRPTAIQPGQLIDVTWCTGGERCRFAYTARKPSLNVTEDVQHQLHVASYEGHDAEDAWKANLQRAVGARVKPGPSF